MTTQVLKNCKPASAYTSVDLRDPVQIRFSEDDRQPITVPQLFENTVRKIPNRPALLSQDQDKKWISLSYQEYWEKSRLIARAFIRLGLEPRTSCGILAVGCPEWFIAQMAAIMVGGVSVGIYITNSAEVCHHVLLNSNASICVVDDSAQMMKIRSVRHQLPLLKAIIQIHAPFADFVDSEEGYHSWSKVEAMGAEDDNLERLLEKRLGNIVANECAFLIYTSGTVGMPKGVMLSHDSPISLSENAVSTLENKVYGHEVTVSYLPLSHIAAQLMDFFNSLVLGACVYFADRNALKGTLFTTIAEVRPTRFFGVPRVFEKFAERLSATESEMAWLSRLVTSVARKVVKNYHLSSMDGGDKTTRSGAIAYCLASRIIQRPKCAFGFDRCKTFIIGGAASSMELKSFFLGYDMKLFETYGLSEACGSATMNCDEEDYLSCGKPIPGLELKLDTTDANGHGEICIRGRSVFMGYLGSRKLTTEALTDDGWLHTGDIGFLDTKGGVHISGRLKELIVTSGGENIPPVHIENLVKKELPGISNAMVVGDNRKFLSILLSIKTDIDPDTGAPRDALHPDALEWMKRLELPYSSLPEVLDGGPCPKVMQSIQEGIDRANARTISNATRVQKFAILLNDFSIKTGELGPTLKLRRSVVLKKYAELIDSLYRGT